MFSSKRKELTSNKRKKEARIKISKKLFLLWLRRRFLPWDKTQARKFLCLMLILNEGKGCLGDVGWVFASSKRVEGKKFFFFSFLVLRARDRRDE